MSFSVLALPSSAVRPYTVFLKVLLEMMSTCSVGTVVMFIDMMVSNKSGKGSGKIHLRRGALSQRQ
jgi:hypothetical protein